MLRMSHDLLLLLKDIDIYFFFSSFFSFLILFVTMEPNTNMQMEDTK